MKNIDYYEICKQKLKYLNYSNNTIDNYLSHIRKFMNTIDISYSRLSSKDFQSYLNNYKFTSISQQNQIINSIKFLYEKVLEKKYDKVDFQRPRKERKLPRVIDNQHIISQLSKITNLKHRTILSLCYSVGLRVSEIVNLKIGDIDSKQMIITINQAKGKKDRIVPLSENILILLRKYYIEYKPKEYLFNGQNFPQYSVKSCQEIFKKYIDKSSSIHKLRHSCFTFLLDNGTNLKTIQSMAGHNSSKTTEIYLHVSKATLNNVKLPL
jgi:integrase/recombinase XerD